MRLPSRSATAIPLYKVERQDHCQENCRKSGNRRFERLYRELSLFLERGHRWRSFSAAIWSFPVGVDRTYATRSHVCPGVKSGHAGIAVPRTPSRIVKKIRRGDVERTQASSAKFRGGREKPLRRTPWPSRPTPWHSAQFARYRRSPSRNAPPDL